MPEIGQSAKKRFANPLFLVVCEGGKKWMCKEDEKSLQVLTLLGSGAKPTVHNYCFSTPKCKILFFASH